MQLCKYARMQVCTYASMQVYKYMQIHAKLSLCPQLRHFFRKNLYILKYICQRLVGYSSIQTINSMNWCQSITYPQGLTPYRLLSIWSSDTLRRTPVRVEMPNTMCAQEGLGIGRMHNNFKIKNEEKERRRKRKREKKRKKEK